MIDPDMRNAIYQLHLAGTPQAHISRQLHVSPHTVRTIIRQQGATQHSVRKDKIADFRPTSIAMEQEYRWLSAHRPAPFAWQTQDLHASGAVGDAAIASAETGEILLDHGARAFCELLADVDNFDVKRLLHDPSPST